MTTRTLTDYSGKPLNDFVAYLAYTVSHGGADDYEDEETSSIKLGEGHGPTPEAAAADALSQVDAKLAAYAVRIEAEITEYENDDFYKADYVANLAEGLREDVTITTEAVANLKGDWKRDSYHGLIKPMTKGKTWAARFEIGVYASEDSRRFYDADEDAEGQAAIKALLAA